MGYSEDGNPTTLRNDVFAFPIPFKQSPVVFVNVLDPSKHKTTVAPKEHSVVDDMATIQVEGIIKDSVVVKSTNGGYNLPKR
ncbi:hypothetical protein P7H22_20610 [Paenibacillus larvae]|nr:hypothetical protein [Paenibacillus larvae]MDT2242269.1 hypothetical protein [Paenibacillus larvae]